MDHNRQVHILPRPAAAVETVGHHQQQHPAGSMEQAVKVGPYS